MLSSSPDLWLQKRLSALLAAEGWKLSGEAAEGLAPEQHICSGQMQRGMAVGETPLRSTEALACSQSAC